METRKEFIKNNEWSGPDKVWFSCGYFGVLNLWSEEPVFSPRFWAFYCNDPLPNYVGDIFCDTQRGFYGEGKLLDFFTSQLGKPKPGDLWEITMEDGTAYCL